MTTDTFAEEAKPAWAVIAWADDHAVYLELPCTDGPPYISKFPLTAGGLGKALAMMRQAYTAQRKAKPYTRKQRPILKAGAGTTPEQRKRVHSLLKRRGLI